MTIDIVGLLGPLGHRGIFIKLNRKETISPGPILHVIPEKVGRQLHMKVVPIDWQTPPFKQGFGIQGSVSNQMCD